MHARTHLPGQVGGQRLIQQFKLFKDAASEVVRSKDWLVLAELAPVLRAFLTVLSAKIEAFVANGGVLLQPFAVDPEPGDPVCAEADQLGVGVLACRNGTGSTISTCTHAHTHAHNAFALTPLPSPHPMQLTPT